MSFDPGWRTFSRANWGPRSTFRGLTQTDKPGLQSMVAITRGQVGTVVYRSPGGYANFTLAGFTRDSNGAPLPGCKVDLILTAGGVFQSSTISAADGSFKFEIQPPGPYFLVAYKAGAPDVAGTTANNLTTS